MSLRSSPPLQVIGFVGTKRGDPERGPQLRMRADDAALRLINEADFVWVRGPRRSEIASVHFDESLPRGSVILRDIAGVAVSEIVHLERIEPRHE